MEIRFTQRFAYLRIAAAMLAIAALHGCSGGSDADTQQTSDILSPPGQRAPTITGAPQTTAQATVSYSFTPVASDADGDPLAFQITNRPAWATFNSTTGRLSGVPTMGNLGAYSGIVISVSDGVRTTALPAFSIQVSGPPNQAPTITGTPSTTVQAGQPYSFQPTGVDPEGGAITYTIQGMPTWASFNQTTGRLTGTPSAANVGIYNRIVISVSDSLLATSSLPAFSIQVTSVGNNAPVISGTPNQTIPAGSIYSFVPAASDPDGNPLTFSIQNRPAWASFTAATGTLTGTPTPADAGLYQGIVISVFDGQVTVSLPVFSINVTQSGNGTATFTWTAPTTNTDGTPLTDLSGYRVYYGVSVTALTSTIDVPAGTLMQRIDALNSGLYYFAVTARNALGAESDLSQLVWKLIP